MSLVVSRLTRWLGGRALVVIVRRDADIRTLRLPADLPVSVRENTDGSVGLTVGHADDGEALLADLQTLMGGEAPAEAPSGQEV